MTKKQSVWYFVLGFLYAVLVASLPDIDSEFLAHILAYIALIHIFLVLLFNENKKYGK